MTLTSGYAITNIGGNFIAVPVCPHERVLRTNEVGGFILDEIKNGYTYDEILEHMAIKYEAQEDEMDMLVSDLDDFLYQARTYHIIEDDLLEACMAC